MMLACISFLVFPKLMMRDSPKASLKTGAHASLREFSI